MQMFANYAIVQFRIHHDRWLKALRQKKQQSEIAFLPNISFELFWRQWSSFPKTIAPPSILKVCHKPSNFIIHSIVDACFLSYGSLNLDKKRVL